MPPQNAQKQCYLLPSFNLQQYTNKELFGLLAST